MDNYMGSPYGHWDYTLFERFSNKAFLHRKFFNKSFLSDFLGGVKYVSKSNDLLLIKLIDYYKDLNRNLERMLEGSYDRMFFKYAFGVNFFRHEEGFKENLQLWDDIFSFGLQRYLKDHHYSFNETFGISYVTYFDIWFSYCIFYEYKNAFALHNKSGRKEYKDTLLSRDIPMSSITTCLESEKTLLEYPSRSFYQELFSQSFSPLQVTIV